MKPVLLFDIDFTLIDSSLLREIIWNKEELILDVSYLKLKELQTAYTKSLSKSTEFNPRTYVRHLGSVLNCQQKPILDLYLNQPESYRKALYMEVLGTLRLLKRSYRLGIFTEGFRKFQSTKLELSGLLPFFNPKLIFVHRRKLTPAAVKRLPKGATIVDDNHEVVETLLKFPSIIPVWLNRKDKKKHPKARTIGSLKELQ